MVLRTGESEGGRAIQEIDVLWLTAGLGCDGDSVSITAATQPSIEDVLLGAIPGLPKVHLHNPVLAYENGAEFMAPFHAGCRIYGTDSLLQACRTAARTATVARQRMAQRRRAVIPSEQGYA